jgi:hypothetical protein
VFIAGKKETEAGASKGAVQHLFFIGAATHVKSPSYLLPVLANPGEPHIILRFLCNSSLFFIHKTIFACE